jgi:hypothetical protein
VGADGALYVADYGSNKIRKITFGDPTTTVLTASAATVTSGASVTLTATVTHQPPTGSAVTPTGTVTFQAGTTTLGTGTLNGSGVATLAVDSATLAEGSSNLTAGYGGRSGGTQPNLAVSTSTAVALTVNRAPTLPGTVTTTAFTPGTAGSFQFTATGVPAPTFTTASTLPSGVTLSSSGLLAGTAAAGTGGNYPITVSASNGIGGPATRSFTLVVTSPPAFSGSSTLNAVAGSPVSVLVGAAGFPAETNSNLITNDFSAATLPTGWTTSGVAAVTGGILQLTPASNNSRGIVTLPAVGATSPTGFSARFKLIVSNAGGADGLSFNYGALLTGTTLTGTASLETGMVSAGLVVTFGEFGDDRMEVRYNNKILSAGVCALRQCRGQAGRCDRDAPRPAHAHRGWRDDHDREPRGGLRGGGEEHVAVCVCRPHGRIEQPTRDRRSHDRCAPDRVWHDREFCRIDLRCGAAHGLEPVWQCLVGYGE